MIFEIEGEYLHINGRYMGAKVRKRVLLRSLDPDFDYEIRRYLVPFVASMALVLIMAVLMRFILSTDYFPHVLAIWPGYGLGIALFGGLIWWPKFAFFVFSDQWGKPAVRLTCEGKQRGECEAFVAELVAAIENPGLMLSPDPDVEEFEVEAIGETKTEPKSNWRWLVSILMGSLAVGLPWLNWLMDVLGVLGFMMVFTFSVLGAVCGIWSFLYKEDMRYMAIYGVLLSLIPPFFYS